MSATISLASNRASERTDFRLTVQLLRRVRGMLMISNSTPRQSGCRSSALATRQRISSMVAGRFTQIASSSMSHPPSARSGGGPSSRTIVGTDMVNGPLRPHFSGAHGPGDGGNGDDSGGPAKAFGARRRAGRRHRLDGDAGHRDIRVLDGRFPLGAGADGHPAADGA